MQVKSGCVPFDVGAESEDDFLNFFFFDPVEHAFDVQHRGADASQRVDQASENMIPAIVLVRAFQRDDIFHVLYHTEQLGIAVRVGADLANLPVGDVVAALAELHILPKVDDGSAELLGFFLALLQNVQRQPQRGFAANARQARQFVDCFLYRLGWILHSLFPRFLVRQDAVSLKLQKLWRMITRFPHLCDSPRRS